MSNEGEAEWAARWHDVDSREDITKLAAKLELDGKQRDFKVWFSFASEPVAPASCRWILRRRYRLDKEDRELTLKLRGKEPPAPDTWPLPKAPDSQEWDVSLTPNGSVNRSYSQSITWSEEGAWPQVPADWRIGLWSRPVIMHRIKSGSRDQAVEFWNVGKHRYIEISRRGPLDDEPPFRDWVTQATTTTPLLEMGMTALVTGVRG